MKNSDKYLMFFGTTVRTGLVYGGSLNHREQNRVRF